MNNEKTDNKNNHYWNSDVDAKLMEFVNTDDIDKRNEIYNNHLLIPISKIANAYAYLIRCYPYTREDIIKDCITHLFFAIPKIDLSKKNTAFSYLSFSARNYYKQLNVREINKEKRNISIETKIKNDAGEDMDDTSIGDTLIFDDSSNYPVREDASWEFIKQSIVKHFDSRNLRDALSGLDPSNKKLNINMRMKRMLSSLGSTYYSKSKSSKPTKQYKSAMRYMEYLRPYVMDLLEKHDLK